MSSIVHIRRGVLLTASGLRSLWSSNSLLTSGPSIIQIMRRGMAGHSHWHNIRHIKEAKDTIRQKTAMDMVRKIKLAVIDGGSANPKLNSILAKVLEEGKSKDVSSSTMTDAIKRLEKGQNIKGGQLYIEGRGIGNVALIIETHTDKPKWMRQQIQHVLKQYGGRIGDSGTSSLCFDFKGVVYSPIDPVVSVDRAVEAAIEAGAEDVHVETDYETYQFICDPKQLHAVKKSLLSLGFKVHESRQEYLPHTFVALDSDTLELASKMLDSLESIDEVTRIFDNIDATASCGATHAGVSAAVKVTE